MSSARHFLLQLGICSTSPLSLGQKGVLDDAQFPFFLFFPFSVSSLSFLPFSFFEHKAKTILVKYN